jgi:hypothetical protein
MLRQQILRHACVEVQGESRLQALESETILGERKIDSVEEILVAKRLYQEINSAGLSRTSRCVRVSVGSDKDDGYLDVGVEQLPLQIQPAHSWQPYIENQTAGAARQFAF